MKLLKKSVAYVLSFITVFSSFTILPSEFFHSAVVSAVEMLTAESNWKETYTEGDFTYSIINDNEVEIVDYNGINTNVVIPDVTTGSECSELANKKVTVIGEEVFYGMILTSVTFGKNITAVGKNAFYKNKMLVNIDLSVCTNLISIGDYAFYENDTLTTITLPDSLKSIGNRAFYNCKKLTKLKTGSKLTNIGKYAFYNCDSLSYVHISGGNNATIGYNAFYDCTGLKAVTIGSGVRFINYEAFKNCKSLRELKIANTVITIGIYAFYGCSALETITIPNSVQAVGNYAFANNTALKNVNIGSSCATMEPSVFDGDKALENFTVAENNSTYSSDDGVLMNKDKTRIILVPQSRSGTYTIPDTVKAIKAGTFAGCKKITGIVIGDGLISVSANTFEGCTNLQKITFGEKITSIGDSAFKNNKSLKEVDFSACTWLTTIGDYAFYGNKALASLKLPDSLQTIGDYAFANCNKFTTLEIGANIASIGKEAFANCDSLNTVNIKGGDDATIGERAFYDCNAMQHLTIGDDINSIGSNAFASCDKLETVTIGGGCTRLDVTVFSNSKHIKSITVSDKNTGCTSVDGMLLNKEKTEIILVPKFISGKVTIPDTVKEIRNDCFRECINLTEVVIGNGVQTIGNYAFDSCKNLSKITFGKNVRNMGYRCFYNNQLLETVDLSECTNLTRINSNTFYNSSAIKTLLLPSSLEIIDSEAFYGCKNLTSLELKGNLTLIGKSAFNGCSKLETLTIENCNNAFISERAFNSCYNLKNLTIGNGVQTLAKESFRNCDSLTTVYIGDDVEVIGYSAFDDCDGLKEVIIGTGVTTIASGAFYNCPNLKRIQILGKEVKSLSGNSFSLKYSIYCHRYSNTDSILLKKYYNYAMRYFKNVYSASTIKVNGVSIEGFNENTREYTVDVDDVTNVDIVPVFDNANISYTVSAKGNVYKLNIFDESHIYSGTYTITVKNSGTVYPNNITVNGTPIKDFKQKTLEYTIYVDDITNVNIEPVFEKSKPNYKVTVKDNVYTIDIFVGNNVKLNTYKITVKNLADVILTDIKANDVSVIDFNTTDKEFKVYVKENYKVTIVPEFKNNVYSYIVRSMSKATAVSKVYELDIYDKDNIYICTYTINVIKDCYAVIGDIELELSYRYSGTKNYCCRNIRLPAGTYKFKIAKADKEFGYNKTIENESDRLTLSEKYKSEITLNATGGVYTFIYNKETGKLIVDHNRFNYLT